MENVDVTAPAPTSPLVPARDLPEDSCSVRLSERDAEQVLQAADNPPAPNAAALAGAKRFLQQRHG
jgi:uncharacterized protein (DUF1778 family)